MVTMTFLEIAANATTALCIFLAARNNVHTWWTGIVACVLFAVLFYQSQLYADVVLQGFFVVTGAIGWYQWMHSPHNRHLQRPITSISPPMLLASLVGGAAVAGLYGAFLYKTTDAYMPYVDATVLAFSVVAQILLMQRKIETWMFWILVNSISVPLYFSRGLYLTAFMYSLFFVNAFYGLYKWRKESDLS